MNQLFKLTSLETTYGIILLALDHFRPVVMNLKQMIQCYITHREEIVRRRTKFDLEKAENRAHILEGFIRALDIIDEIIAVIRASKTPKEAADRLVGDFGFTKIQAEAILDMKLARLTGLEREKIQKEYDELLKLIARLREILKSRKNILTQIVKELKEIQKKYGNERRTDIIEEEKEVDLKDLIIEEDVVVTISHNGFIKRTPITAFRHQSRGGMGVTTSSLSEDDVIEQMFVASTHDTLLFISDSGKAYTIKVHEIVNVGRSSKGQSIKLLLSLREEETLAAAVSLKGSSKEEYLLFLTKKGFIKKVSLSEFQNVRISLAEDDSVIGGVFTDGKREIFIATTRGYALRLKEGSIRPMGRTARGVTAIRLQKDDYVCGMTKVIKDADLLVVTENGYGKRVGFENFTPHGRGTRGQLYIKENTKTGIVVGVLAVEKNDAFVVITNRGMIIKLKVKTISRMGKSAGGIMLVNLKQHDSVAAVSRIVQD
jgi:DNA gyrase subunit A